MALNTAVLWAGFAALGDRDAASRPFASVTLQAGSPVDGDAILWADERMGIVTGDATDPLTRRTASKATALLHLLDVVDGFAIRAASRRPYEHRQEILQRLTGPEVVEAASATDHPCHAFQVTLLANRVAQGRRHARGVDDGGIESIRGTEAGVLNV